MAHGIGERLRRACALATALAASVATPAFAQVVVLPTDQAVPSAPQPPVQATITLPVIKHDEGAEYPAQALTDGVKETVTVIL
ncbi:MAG: hypothetical protein ABIP39_01655, partial [Polyangiaceae bacterium]